MVGKLRQTAVVDAVDDHPHGEIIFAASILKLIRAAHSSG